MAGMLQVLMASTYLKSIAVSAASLVYDLDAAYFGAVPGTGAYVSTTEGSNYFPTSSYLACGTALTLGTTCTVEGWFYTTSDPATSKIVLVAGNGNRGISIYNGAYGQTNYSATKFTVDWETAGNNEFTVPTMTANTWYHLAVTQNAGVMTLWLNGVRSTTGAVTLNWNFQSQNYRVGGWSSQNIYSQGVYISNVRITTTAVYDVTSATITVPTGPLTAVTGTQLLLNSSTSATALTDSSTNAMTMTSTGSTKWSALTPFSTAGNYPLTITNAGSVTWNSGSGGYFAKSNTVGTDHMTGGPNYTSTSQSYSVFVAYQANTVGAGRMLNTASEATNDWLATVYYNGVYNKNVFYPAAALNLTGDTFTSDSGWNFLWATFDATTAIANLYIASATVNNTSGPSAVYKTATYGIGSSRGFNQLRMWSRAGGGEVQTGNFGFIKVYNGALSLAQVQSQWTAYHSRFSI